VEVVVPDLGDFADVEVIEVLVKPGDSVAAEQGLITLETDKATMDIPSPAAGKIAAVKVKTGDRVSAGSVIAALEEPDGKKSAAQPASVDTRPESDRTVEMPKLARSAGAADAREPRVVTVPDLGDFSGVEIIDVLVSRGDVKQQRRGNVVRQVPDDAQPATAHAGERREIELERVGFVQLECLRRPPAGAQLRGEIAVDFDRIQRAGLADEPFGERATAGPDLEQCLVGLRRDFAHDAIEHAAVMQEMLAEPLAREDQARLAANSTARRVAAMRLPASARPVPARSSAVPWSTDVRMIGRPSVTFTAWPKPACLSTGRPWS